MLPRRKLGEMLLVRGLITGDQLERGLEHQQSAGGRIGSTLVDLGFLSEDELLRFLSLAYDVPQIDLRRTEVQSDAIDLLPPSIARETRMVPVRLIERPPDKPVLIVATPDPTDWDSVERVRQVSGCLIEPFVCSHAMFERYFDQAYQSCHDVKSVRTLLSCYDREDVIGAVARVLVEKGMIDIDELREALTEEHRGRQN